jgi:tungstate transport system permease protein
VEFIVNGLVGGFRMIVSWDYEVYFILWTSLKVSAWAILLAALLGVPAGLVVALKNFRGKGALILTLNTCMALPTVVIGLFLYALLSRRGPMGGLGLLFTPWGVSAGLFVLSLPLVANLTLSAIQAADPRLFMTCRLLGATALQQALMIIKEARFAVMAGIVVAFGRVVSEVGIAMMLGGNIKDLTRTMTTAIALETSKGEFELGIALGVLLLTVAFLVNAGLFMLQRSKG